MALTRTLYRVSEVAEYFDVSRMTVYRWIERGQLPVVTVRPCRIASRDVDALEKILSQSSQS